MEQDASNLKLVKCEINSSTDSTVSNQ